MRYLFIQMPIYSLGQKLRLTHDIATSLVSTTVNEIMGSEREKT